MTDQIQENRTEQIKLWSPVLIVIVALGLFYSFPDLPILVRTLAMIVVVSLGVAIFFTSDKGKEVAGFLKNARIELRKMVWPTRTETVQTTFIVLVAVIIIALILWIVDLFLSWFMAMVIQ